MSSTPSIPSGHESPTSDLSVPPELLENIPEEQRDRLLKYVNEAFTAEHFSGLLPPPSVLSQYEPDVQRIIFEAAVENRLHRTAVEARVQQMDFSRKILGLLFGFLLAFIMIVSSIHIIHSGYRAEGLIGIGGTVAAVAVTFIYTDRQRRSDRQATRESSAYLEYPDYDTLSGSNAQKAKEGNNA